MGSGLGFPKTCLQQVHVPGEQVCLGAYRGGGILTCYLQGLGFIKPRLKVHARGEQVGLSAHRWGGGRGGGNATRLNRV